MAPGALTGSHLIRALSEPVRDSLLARSRVAYLSAGEEPLRPGTPGPDVLFPVSCVLSLVTRLQDGTSVEIATVGRHGMTGAAQLSGWAVLPSVGGQVLVGGSALAVRGDEFGELVDAHPELRDLCVGYLGVLMTQMAQGLACARAHGTTERAARWLLMMQDQTGSAELHLTHDLLGSRLGTRRETVSHALRGLHTAGVIRSGHGQLEIVDRRGLEARACECYRVMREARDRALVARRAPSPAGSAGPAQAPRRPVEPTEPESSGTAPLVRAAEPARRSGQLVRRRGHELASISRHGAERAAFAAVCVCGWATPARPTPRLAESVLAAHLAAERARAASAAAALMRVQTMSQRLRASEGRARLAAVAEAIRDRARGDRAGSALTAAGLVRVAHADDDAGLRQGLAEALARSRRFDLVGQGATGVEAVALATVERPRILVVGDRMPVMSGPEAISLVRRLVPDVRVCLHAEEPDHRGPADRGPADLVVAKREPALIVVERLAVLAA